jgi:ArsR family transcriptional regulator
VTRTRKSKPAVRDDGPGVPDATLEGMVDLFQMLGDKTRLRILLALAHADELHVTALCDLLGLLQPAVSHHLSLLRSKKLVACRRDGKNNFYAVDSGQLGQLLDQFFGDAGRGQRQIHLDGFSLALRNR